MADLWVRFCSSFSLVAPTARGRRPSALRAVGAIVLKSKNRGRLMADEFKVDLGQLHSFGRVLKQSVTDLEEARSALSAVSADQIGTPRLDEACETFQNKWKYGTGQLKDMIKAVDEGVEKTAQSYQQFEENLSKALKKMEETHTANAGGK
ncbi:hypothetical protein TUSST3_24630 [Streptomyces sp. TUS-ST3]|nr:hypothetical protein TUSST3_24630 [Streptomyces sp. TUS-ST3]